MFYSSDHHSCSHRVELLKDGEPDKGLFQCYADVSSKDAKEPPINRTCHTGGARYLAANSTIRLKDMYISFAIPNGRPVSYIMMKDELSFWGLVKLD